MPVRVEYLNANMEIAFPFRDDAPGLRRFDGDSRGMPSNLFVDAVFEVPHDFQPGKHLYLMGCRRIAEDTLLAEIGDGEAVIVSVTIVAGGEMYTAAAGSGGGVTARLVVNSTALREYLANLPEPIPYRLDLPFELCTQGVINPQALSFSIYNRGPHGEPDAVAVSGDVSIRGGYNVNVRGDLAERDTTPVTIDAVAGEGLGQLPCLGAIAPESNVPVGLSPHKGNILLRQGEDGCYAIVPHPGVGIVQIQGRCRACCSCDDMKDMLDVLRGIGERIVATRATLDAGRAAYEAGVTAFNGHISEDYTRVTMRANGMRGADWAVGHTHRGSPNWARIVIVFSNRRRNPVVISSWSALFFSPISDVCYEDVAWESDGRGGKVGLVKVPDPDYTHTGGALPPIERDRRLSVTMLVSVPLSIWLSNPRWRAVIEATAVDTNTGETDSLRQRLEFS